MNIERALLLQLDRVGGLLLPEQTLLDGVNLALPRKLTLSVVQHTLGDLEALGQVTSVQSRDHGTRWRITDNGIARLQA